MKKIEAIIEPSGVQALREKLSELGVRTSFTIAEVYGIGANEARPQVYRGRRYESPSVTEAKVEMVVPDEAAERIAAVLREKAKTDEFGNGRVFVLPLEDVAALAKMRKGAAA